MSDLYRTSTVLLNGLRDSSDSNIWASFDRRYRPIIVGFALSLGLRPQDAADVAQETMTQFLLEFRAGHYDPARGRLRTWLIALAKSRIAQLRRSRARLRDWRGDSALIDLADEAELDRLWQNERRKYILQQALVQLRTCTRFEGRTIDAFELLVLRAMPVGAVANQLGMSAHDVYLAKSRVTRRLRELVATLEASFDDDVVVPADPTERSGAAS
jgi:RNA polymerase sigma-70 factor, ECF subfamily